MARCARCGRKVDKPSRSVEAGEIVCPTCRPPAQRQTNQREGGRDGERRPPRSEAPAPAAIMEAPAPAATAVVEAPAPAETRIAVAEPDRPAEAPTDTPMDADASPAAAEAAPEPATATAESA